MTNSLDEKEDQAKDSACVELSVVNVHQLGVGLAATYVFDEWGGSIGSSPQDNWVLRDNQGDIQLSHAEIRAIDGHFCLTDNCDATFINGANQAIGYGKSVRLNDKDIVQIGAYQLRVNLTLAGESKAKKIGGLEQVFSTQVDLLNDEVESRNVDTSSNEILAETDPLKAFDSVREPNQTQNIFDSPREADEDALTNPANPKAPISVQADSEYELGAAIMLKKQSPSEVIEHLYSSSKTQNKKPEHILDSGNCTGNAMKTNFDDRLLEQIEEEMEKDFSRSWEQNSNPFTGDESLMGFDTERLEETNHVVVGPLLKGLGVKIGDPSNMGKMQALSQEMGESLQATIQGLLMLHQQVEDSRFGMMNKNLQPIEDNPLRLGLSYQETVETLFDGQRSMVHLSAPSAIEESLKTVGHHNEAVQEATTHALSQILHAFSPDVLMRRFSAYQRTGQVPHQSPEAWAWGMYQNYFKELTSNRQKGFEKLFWEIFEQAYDKKIRELQREN